jgi:hypothetical protein
MRPRLDPFAASPEEDMADALDLYAWTEIMAGQALRPRARLIAGRVLSGHLYRGIGGHARLCRRRLAIRSWRANPDGGWYVVLRRGREVVRLPYA